jgi:hypothetical protein
VVERPHSEGSCSINGGYVYRGTRIPELVGTYIYSDYCSNRIWWLKWSKGAITDNGELSNDLDIQNLSAISSFGEDTAGELYVVALGSQSDPVGRVFRIEPE